MSDRIEPVDPGRSHAPGAWILPLTLAVMAAGLAWLALAWGGMDRVFDALAHQFHEIPVLTKIRRPSQIPLFRGHLAILAGLTCGFLVAWPWIATHARRIGIVFLVGYALRATAWIAGGNLPLVPGDSCHYLEVATSVYRGEGPVKHYVESYFRDYPRIRSGQGVLDDWATPLQAYVLAGAFRLTRIEPGRDLEQTVGVAKGVSFLWSLLALPAIYGFGARRFGRCVGLGAMALLAILPVHVIYAGFALRESLVALTSILAVWTLTEVWTADTIRSAWGMALLAGVCGGLAILARNTALALMAGAGLYGLFAHGRRRIGPLLLWGFALVSVITPWAWATNSEYGKPFYTYTDYFPYNFSWTIHHYEKGNTTPEEFFTAENRPEIIRVKIKSVAIILVTSTMILSLPLTIATLVRIRKGNDTDRLLGALALVFVLATLYKVVDVTQVAQLGRYYLPLFVLALPTAAAGVSEMLSWSSIGGRARIWLATGLVALLWADPTWAYDASWFGKPYQLHWPAIRESGDWVRVHPDLVPPDARIMTWFPWEVRVASDRTTVLMPRNYSLARINDVIRQYGVTHVLWGSFEPPEHVDPESWASYLSRLRIGVGLTDDREIHASPTGVQYPVRLYRIR